MTVKGTTPPTTLWVVPSTSSDGGQYGNHRSEDEDWRQAIIKALHVFSMVICSIAFLLGVTSNGLVIYVTGFRMKRTVNTIWFLNLAVADFLFTVFLPFSIAYAALGFRWPFGGALCKFSSGLTFLNLYVSVYLLMVISIDRCISVVCPVWAQNHRTPRLATWVALTMWIIALALCSPNVYFRHAASYHNETGICYNDFISSGEGAMEEQSEEINQRAMIISRFVFSFLIPFIIILCCYGAILIKLKRNHLARSSKPFKVITAVIITFLLCWFPYYVFSFLEMDFTPSRQNALIIGLPLTASLASINSCLNPIIYVFMGQGFNKRISFSLLSAFENTFAEGTKNKSSKETDPKSSRHHVPIERGELELCSA